MFKTTPVVVVFAALASCSAPGVASSGDAGLPPADTGAADAAADTPAKVCVPGSTRACACLPPATGTGSQTCDAAGAAYGTCGPCVCKPKTPCECGDDGCGTSCGACVKGYQCNSNRCDLDPSGLWVLAAVNGTVSTAVAWNAGGGAPDPYVCLTKGVWGRLCTTAKADTFFPAWGEVYPDTSAANLLGEFTFEYADEDVAVDDLICAIGPISIEAKHFKSGALDVSCSSGASAVHFTLTAK